MPSLRFGWLLAPVFIIGTLVACGDDDGSTDESPTGSATTATGATNDPSASPDGPILTPPLEGPPREGTITERTNFREEPGWVLPEPDEVPPPEDSADPIFNPPASVECPVDWQLLDRPIEGFQICHPQEWVADGQGYVASANEERWYSLGLFDFPNGDREHQRAHVSVYVIPQFTRPLRYTLDCPEPHSITFAGEPAVICAEFPAQSPEARIVSYHVYRENLDYFVQIVDYFEYDAADDEYTGSVDEDVAALAVQIAHTFKFTPVLQFETP